ncbi:MAG: hypothetical protein LLF94_11920 [Chlamydiales bacterium]|nr:hypothetical protein [Chlamydiales bacterium]
MCSHPTVAKLEAIERAIETVRLFNEQKPKTLESDDSLQKSLDLLKIYTSAAPYLQKGSEKERHLAKRVLETAKKYNEVVRVANKPPESLGDILLHFFAKLGKKSTLVHHEIHIPHQITVKEQTPDKIRSVLQSVQRNSDADYSLPKQTELDLFRTKALSLLLEQHVYELSMPEAIGLIQKTPISYRLDEGAYLLQDNILQLNQILQPLPGVEITLTGAFQRDPFHPDLAIPVKSSFSCRCHIVQTGFSHSLQYVGMGLHEKLFPQCILRPEMCPEVAALLLQKNALSKELLPNGKYFQKAKDLYLKRSVLFAQNPEITSLLHTLLATQNLKPESALLVEQHIALPINGIQEEWFVKHNESFLQNPYATGFSLITKTDEALFAFSKAAVSIHLMQLSEHLGFQPRALSAFEKTLLIALFRQQLIFIYELEHVQLDDLESHLIQTLKDEIALYKGTPSKDLHTLQAQELTEELIQYYTSRYQK